MKLLVSTAAVLAGVAAAGSAAAPAHVVARAQTVVATRSHVTQFAQDGNWLAWVTVSKGCDRRLHILSLRSRKETRIDGVGSRVGCGTSGLALAGSRAAWMRLVGAGNTELDYAVGTATAATPKARRVRSMAMIRREYAPEPLLPPIAGRGGTIAYYRHEDGIGGAPSHTVERLAGSRPQRVFRFDDPSALAVDGGRIAAARRVLEPGDACNCNFDPAWSRDGTKIAFVSDQRCCVDEQEQADVYVMDANGYDRHARTRVTTDGDPKLGVVWSPDGKQLAFGYTAAGLAPKIAIVNADGTGRHDVGDGRYPSWSPDGTRLAFDDGRNRVVVSNIDGSGTHQVATGSRPAWSPDGSRIAYENGAAVFSTRLDGSDTIRVSEGMTAPAWSPNGTSIAGAAQNGIRIVRADGSSAKVLAGSRRGDGDPTWSPDGTRIVFDSLWNDLDGDGYAEPELYASDATGGNLQPLTFYLPADWYTELQVRSNYGRLLSRTLVEGTPLGLALDGRFAVVLTRGAHATAVRLAIVGAGSGQLRHFLAVPANALGLIAARDGRCVFVAGGTIRTVALASGQTRVATFTRGKVVGVAISGRRIWWAENIGHSGRIRTLLLPR
jgi:TolB protein